MRQTPLHSKAHVKPSDPVPELKLTSAEQDIMDRKQGELLQKAFRSVKNGDSVKISEDGTIEIH